MRFFSYWLALLFIYFIPSFSWAYSLPCGQLVKQNQHYYDRLQNRYITRDYLIYLPRSFCEKQKPISPSVIYALHGYHGTASGFALSTSQGLINRLSEGHNWIAVYPQGMSMRTEKKSPLWNYFYSSWNFLPKYLYRPSYQSDFIKLNNRNIPICNIRFFRGINPIPKQPGCRQWTGVCAWTACFDDEAYLLAIQSAIIRQFHADKHHQYLIGFSNGAMMAYRMACAKPKQYQAVVAIAGTTIDHLRYHSTRASPSLWIISGLHDTDVPLTEKQRKLAADNPYSYQLATEAVRDYARGLRCQTVKITHSNSLGGMYCYHYTHCYQHKQVRFCLFGTNKNNTLDSRHNFPGGHYGDGWCVSDIQASLAPNYPRCPEPKLEPSLNEFMRLLDLFFLS